MGWDKPWVRVLSSISANFGAMSLGSLPFTPSSSIRLRGLPWSSRCTRCPKCCRSVLIRVIRSSFLVTVCMIVSSLASAVDLPRLKDLRSLSREAICFSNLALSRRSVLPERMATYSEKFMLPCSSMLPSSMVRAPIVPFLSWVMNSCLLWSRLNL